jgi:hypothetical protein
LTYKLGDKSLQDRAFEAIGHRLSEYNIVDELFSKFTSTWVPTEGHFHASRGATQQSRRYDNVKDLEVKYFCDHRRSTIVSSAFREKLREFGEGGMKHAISTVQSAFDAINAAAEIPPVPY